jgi:acetyl esterase
MPLDPVAKAFLDGLATIMPDVGTMSAEDTRTKIAEVGAMLAPSALVTEVTDRTIEVDGAEITVRTYRPPADGPLPVVVYYHGGGWVLGRLEDYDAALDALSLQTGCLIASIDYRMAPEWKFPVPVEDCYAATRWVADRAGELGADPDRMAVAGDSSGGNLAAAVALMCRDRGGPAVALQVLVYPIARCHLEPEGYVQGVDTPPLTTVAMAWYAQQYLSSPADVDNPYASPIAAEDLSGLPPTLLVTAEVDPLRDDCMAFGERLREAGVSLVTSHYSDMFHGFYSFRGFIPQGDQAFEEVASALRHRLPAPAPVPTG